MWQPFLDAVAAAPHDFSIDFAPLKIMSTSARNFWTPTLVKRVLGFIAHDDRPDAPAGNVFWPGDQAQAGPEGLFVVHHGVGSGRWSPDGFTRLA